MSGIVKGTRWFLADLKVNGLLSDAGAAALQLGTVGTPAYATTGDVFVGKQLEVKGSTFFDGGSVYFGLASNTRAYFYDGFLMGSNSENRYGGLFPGNNDGLRLHVGHQSGANRNLIFTSAANYLRDHGHSTLSANPTTWWHSLLDPDTNDTRCGYARHTGTAVAAGAFEVGTLSGDLKLIPAGNIVTDSLITDTGGGGSLQLGTAGTPTYTTIGDVYVGADLEVAGDTNFVGSSYFRGSAVFFYPSLFYNIAEFRSGNASMARMHGFKDDSWKIALHATNARYNMVVTSWDNSPKTHGHAVSINPTQWWHSVYDVDTDNTRCGFARHTGGVTAGAFEIGTLSGHVRLDPATDAVLIAMADGAPADGDLQASEGSFYLNESGNEAWLKVKYADGTTVKTTKIGDLT